MAQAPAGETSVARYVNAELVIPINACLRYKALKHEMPAIQLAAWLQQSHHTPTLSANARQVWHEGWTVHAALPTHVVPLCCASLDHPALSCRRPPLSKRVMQLSRASPLSSTSHCK